MVEICFGNNPEDLSYDQDVMRKHLEQCFVSKEIRPFPKSFKPEIFPRPDRSITKIQLYCVCQMPENYDNRMIECDECNKWFHYSCTDLNHAVIVKHHMYNIGNARSVQNNS